MAEYAYDAFERRTKKVADGVTTHFHYDLNGLLISETDGNGNPREDYVYLNGEPVAMRVYGGSAGWYWFVNDHLGTPQKMVDAAGNVVWATAYAPFGEARVYKDEVTNNLRFPGQYYDVETGLHYNWHRYYDPETGRYLRADPIGLAGGINPYVYAGGNPANFIDLDGLKIETNRKEIEQRAGVPSFSLSTMDFYELMVMAMYPEVLVPMMIGEGIIKGCAPKRLSKRAAIKKAQLPTQVKGKIRFVPPKNWNPSEPLPRGTRGGYMDKFGNEWTKGPSRTKGQSFEWDVQRPDGTHWNISLDGKVTH